VHPGRLRLVKRLDGERVLAETAFEWSIWQPYSLGLEVRGARLRAFLDGRLVFDLVDEHAALLSGGIALVVTEGHMASHAVQVGPPESG